MLEVQFQPSTSPVAIAPAGKDPLIQTVSLVGPEGVGDGVGVGFGVGVGVGVAVGLGVGVPIGVGVGLGVGNALPVLHARYFPPER